MASFDGLVVTLDLGREQTKLGAVGGQRTRRRRRRGDRRAARLNDKVKPWAYALAPWLVDRPTDRHRRPRRDRSRQGRQV